MALTVRLPSGRTVTYRTANYVEYGDRGWLLWTSKEDKEEDKAGSFVALIQPSAGAIVEYVPSWQVDVNAAGIEESLDGVLALVRERICPSNEFRSGLVELKRLLRDFDARTRSWREE